SVRPETTVRTRGNRKVFCTKSRTGAEWGIPGEVAVKSLTVHESHANLSGTPLTEQTVRPDGKSLFL
ncbi:MAG: hypothetical protein ACYCYP_11650, partial [Leptospirales bacterium]